MTGVECVEGMAAGLYEELFAAVVSLINRYRVFRSQAIKRTNKEVSHGLVESGRL